MREKGREMEHGGMRREGVGRTRNEEKGTRIEGEERRESRWYRKEEEGRSREEPGEYN
jgi:hypothetical protein